MDFDFSKPYEKPGTYNSAIKFIDKLWAYSAELVDKVPQPENEANSNNSSISPSSDSLKIKAERKKQNEEDSRRTIEYWRKPKQGAQPGHKGVARALVSECDVDKLIKISPDKTCQKCSASLNGKQVRRRKQVIDIIKGSVFVTQYQLLGGQCHQCNKRYCASLPDDVPKGLFSDTVHAKIGYLSGT